MNLNLLTMFIMFFLNDNRNHIDDFALLCPSLSGINELIRKSRSKTAGLKIPHGKITLILGKILEAIKRIIRNMVMTAVG